MKKKKFKKEKKLRTVVANYYLLGIVCGLVFAFEFIYFSDIKTHLYMIFLLSITGAGFIACMLYFGYMAMYRIKQLDTRKYRREMYAYFRLTEWGYETTITKVNIYQTMNNIVVEVETHRPGILIGKAGHYIDKLTEYLQEEIDPTIKIHIKECELWHKLYTR